jgi:hypothetical protein
MAYMPYDHNEGQRGVIKRAAQELLRRANEFLDWTEECVFRFEPDGLGLRVGIRSIRARQIFELLHRSVFRGFEPHAFHYEGGRVWARFGYY